MFPARVYSVEFEAQTIAAASGDVDLFYIAPADDKPVCIVGMVAKTTSELQEAQEEWLRWRIIRGHATVGSGGAAATARPVNENDIAAGFTARTLDTTIASAGTAVNMHSDAFQVRIGEVFWPPPEARIMCAQTATTIVVRLMAAVADDVTASGTLYVGEMN
jgi:hypothetical protein